MRRPGGVLIGKIRLHRKRDRHVRAKSSAAPDHGSAENTRAQRIEVFSEDSRLLRNLLLSMALLSFVYAFQAGERVSAVQTLIDAHGLIAFEAVLSSRLTTPSTFQSFGTGSAAPDIDVLPSAQARPELIADVTAQAMLELEQNDLRTKDQWGKVTLFSPTLNGKVEALLVRVDRPVPLQVAAAHASDALVLGLLSRSRMENRSQIVEQMEQVEQRCPSKWLQAGASYRYFVAEDSALVGREVMRLSMGSGTWMLSGFRLVNERGTRAPLIDAIAEPMGFRLYFFRMAEPSLAVGGLDCDDFVLRWGYEFVGMTPPVLLDAVADDGHLSPAYRQSIDDARRRLSRLSVRLAEGIDFGVLGVFVLIPLAMVILSVWLSVVLRRLASDTGGRIRELLVAVPLQGPRRTVLDGPHFFYLERLVRVWCIAYPIIAPPLVVLSVPIILPYPDIHVGLSSLFGRDERLNPMGWRQIAELALKTPAFYVSAVLFVQAAHQLLLTFGSRQGRVR